MSKSMGNSGPFMFYKTPTPDQSLDPEDKLNFNIGKTKRNDISCRGR